MVSIVSMFYFFLIAGILGLTIIKTLRVKLSLLTTMVGGWLAGICSLTTIIFWQSFWTPFTKTSIILSISFIGISCGLWWHQQKFLKQLRKKITTADQSSLKILLPFLLFWGVCLGLVWRRMLVLEVDGLYAGWVNVWGDWAAHLSYTTSFAWGNNFPPQMPLLAGHKFSYPFLADFLSAVMIKLGSPLLPAMLIPSWILSMLLITILIDFGRVVIKSLKGGIITAWLFLLNGGLGWWWFFKDLKEQGIRQLIINLPREYTHLQTNNIQWINIITSQVIPQRGFLLGFPLTVFIYLLLWKSVNAESKNQLRLAGLLTALLPLIHGHCFLLTGFIATGMVVKQLLTAKQGQKKMKIIRKWLGYFLPVILLGIPQGWYFYAEVLSSKGFIRWLPGWMAYKDNSGPILFWLKNLGIMWLLIIGGSWLANKKLKHFSIPFWILFIIANLWLFQPWEWDNTKFFVHWYLIASVLGAGFIVTLLNNKRIVIKILAITMVILATLSGWLDMWHLSQYQQRKLKLFNNQQLRLAEWVKKNIPSEAVFLTADNHDHWLVTLTGRKTVLGYKGWLWTYGINYSERSKFVETIFQGNKQSKSLLAKEKIDYVVIGPMERTIKSGINQDFFENNYSLVYQLGDNKIYKVAD